MDYIIKRTTELSDREIELFCELFDEVFIGHHKSPQAFKDEYLNTALGYSYHSLLFSDGKLVGAHNNIPMNYKFNGESLLFCLDADTMIKKEFRSLINLMQLVKNIEKTLKGDGISFAFGFPNENSHSIMKRLFKYKDIGILKTYILPYRIGGIKPKLKLLNSLSLAMANFLSFLSKLRKSNKSVFYLIDKDREAQIKYRLKWFGSDYKVCHLEACNFIYRILVYNNVRTAFLIDIDKVSPVNISLAIRQIIKNDNKNFDLIMYVGCLPFNAFPLIKIPQKLEPKKFNFYGKFLNTEKTDEKFLSLENWNVNLSCYDLV
jgi:hypothetical protein